MKVSNTFPSKMLSYLDAVQHVVLICRNAALMLNFIQQLQFLSRKKMFVALSTQTLIYYSCFFAAILKENRMLIMLISKYTWKT